jgi:hypothetical protein
VQADLALGRDERTQELPSKSECGHQNRAGRTTGPPCCRQA